jgi:NAD+ synthase (glutamine-hydrolysing)
MKIALVQFNPVVGDISGNTERIISFLEQAKSNVSDLVIFPELAICGYPPLDLLDYHSFVQNCELAMQKISGHCLGIAAIVGSPQLNFGKGKPIFNAAWYINPKMEIEKVVHKTLLPNYDVFDESRYFESNTNFETIFLKGKTIGITICEDIWFNSNKKGFLNGGAGSYLINPLEELRKLKPDLVINISASPFAAGKSSERKNLVAQGTAYLNCPLVYVNQCGANAELIFDGASMVFMPNGNLLHQSVSFEEAIDYVHIEESSLPQMLPSMQPLEEIEGALLLGIKDFFRKQGFKKAILGLSGGVDSALTLYLAVKALGAENVFPLMLPSQFSSNHSILDSIELCKNLNCKVERIEIEGPYQEMLLALQPFFHDLPFSLAEENIQARIRGTLLMAISNKFGYILLNTTNKSEMAVGYGTSYGDLCGGLGVLGDLYKTEVYELCGFINRNAEIIPQSILEKAPSAELRPNQKDQDSLPPYPVLDNVLKLYLEERKFAPEIITLGFDQAVVQKVIGLVNASEYKRKQTPPVLRISEKAFGTGRRMPLVAHI